MAYPHNPNLSFKPSMKEHFIAFDSALATNQNKYTIEFEQPYRNVVSIGVESALLPKNDNEYVALKLNNISNLESSGIMNNGTIHNAKVLNDAFSIFHFDPNISSDKQFFSQTDVRPNHRELRTPIGKLASLDISWETAKYYNSIDSSSWGYWYEPNCFDSEVREIEFVNNSTYIRSTATYLETMKFKVYWIENIVDDHGNIKAKKSHHFSDPNSLSTFINNHANSNVYADHETTVEYYLHNSYAFDSLENIYSGNSIKRGTHTIIFKITTCS